MTRVAPAHTDHHSEFELHQRVASLETWQRTCADDIAAIRQDLHELRRGFTESRNTPWSTLISAFAVTIVVIGAVGSSWLAPMKVRIDAILELDSLRSQRQMAMEDRVRAIELQQAYDRGSSRKPSSRRTAPLGGPLDPPYN